MTDPVRSSNAAPSFVLAPPQFAACHAPPAPRRDAAEAAPADRAEAAPRGGALTTAAALDQLARAHRTSGGNHVFVEHWLSRNGAVLDRLAALPRERLVAELGARCPGRPALSFASHAERLALSVDQTFAGVVRERVREECLSSLRHLGRGLRELVAHPERAAAGLGGCLEGWRGDASPAARPTDPDEIRRRARVLLEDIRRTEQGLLGNRWSLRDVPRATARVLERRGLGALPEGSVGARGLAREGVDWMAGVRGAAQVASRVVRASTSPVPQPGLPPLPGLLEGRARLPVPGQFSSPAAFALYVLEQASAWDHQHEQGFHARLDAFGL